MGKPDRRGRQTWSSLLGQDAGAMMPHPQGGRAAGGFTDCDSESRERQRMKQVNIGRSTEGYANFALAVPRGSRVPGVHLDTPPVSPRVNMHVSKREFEKLLRDWRRFLHTYDDVDAGSPQDPHAAAAAAMRCAMYPQPPQFAARPASDEDSDGMSTCDTAFAPAHVPGPPPTTLGHHPPLAAPLPPASMFPFPAVTDDPSAEAIFLPVGGGVVTGRELPPHQQAPMPMGYERDIYADTIHMDADGAAAWHALSAPPPALPPVPSEQPQRSSGEYACSEQYGAGEQQYGGYDTAPPAPVTADLAAADRLARSLALQAEQALPPAPATPPLDGAPCPTVVDGVGSDPGGAAAEYKCVSYARLHNVRTAPSRDAEVVWQVREGEHVVVAATEWHGACEWGRLQLLNAADAEQWTLLRDTAGGEFLRRCARAGTPEPECSPPAPPPPPTTLPPLPATPPLASMPSPLPPGSVSADMPHSHSDATEPQDPEQYEVEYDPVRYYGEGAAVEPVTAFDARGEGADVGKRQLLSEAQEALAGDGRRVPYATTPQCDAAQCLMQQQQGVAATLFPGDPGAAAAAVARQHEEGQGRYAPVDFEGTPTSNLEMIGGYMV